MTQRMQIYYNAIFGALGALLGWFLIGLLPGGMRGSELTEAILLGAGIGAFIGGAVGVVEGAMVKRSVARAVQGLGFGALAGLVSGAIGLGLGELVFVGSGGGLIGRAAGFVVFGLLLGLGSGLVNRALRRAAYGLIGGALAGLVGGVIYHTMTEVAFQQLGSTELIQTVFGALGLGIVGASLGGITRAAENLIGKAVDRGLLIVQTGRKAGFERRLGDPVVIGSYDGCQLYLPGDMDILKRHARVVKKGRGFVIEPLEGGVVLVNQQPVPPAGQSLQHRDQILVGQTLLVFLAQ